MIHLAQLLLTFRGPAPPCLHVNTGFYSYEHYRCCQGDSHLSAVATQSILIIPSPVRTPAFKIADRLLLSLALHLDIGDRRGPHQVMCDEEKKSGSERKEAPIITAPKTHCCKTKTCFFHS